MAILSIVTLVDVGIEGVKASVPSVFMPTVTIVNAEVTSVKPSAANAPMPTIMWTVALVIAALTLVIASAANVVTITTMILLLFGRNQHMGLAHNLDLETLVAALVEQSVLMPKTIK